jgi:membrane protein
MELTLNLKKIWKFLQLVYIRFRADGCPNRAAALAFTTLLSIVPLLTVSFTVLTAFPVFQEFAYKIQSFIINNFVAASAEIVQSHLQSFMQQTSKLSAIGMLFFLFTAVLMVFNMELAFNAIWRAAKRRRLISAFLMYWAVLTLTPIFVGIGLGITTLLVSLPWISEAANALGLSKIVLFCMPYLFTLVAFTLLYVAVPNHRVKFRFALVGGIVASILFELAKQGFVLYITHFSVYRLLYGALAAVPIFLVWIYLSWLIILFGAVVSATLQGDNP